MKYHLGGGGTKVGWVGEGVTKPPKSETRVFGTAPYTFVNCEGESLLNKPTAVFTQNA